MSHLGFEFSGILSLSLCVLVTFFFLYLSDNVFNDPFLLYLFFSLWRSSFSRQKLLEGSIYLNCVLIFSARIKTSKGVLLRVHSGQSSHLRKWGPLTCRYFFPGTRCTPWSWRRFWRPGLLSRPRVPPRSRLAGCWWKTPAWGTRAEIQSGSYKSWNESWLRPNGTRPKSWACTKYGPGSTEPLPWIGQKLKARLGALR